MTTLPSTWEAIISTNDYGLLLDAAWTRVHPPEVGHGFQQVFGTDAEAHHVALLLCSTSSFRAAVIDCCDPQ